MLGGERQLSDAGAGRFLKTLHQRSSFASRVAGCDEERSPLYGLPRIGHGDVAPTLNRSHDL